MADLNFLLSKVGAISPATKSKAVEIINAAEQAGHKVRFVWGKASSGEHGTGNALDLMVYNEADGDWIRNYVWANRARLRLRHVIWWQHITSTVVQPGVRRLMEDRGNTTENHYDHNHILFLDASAYVPPGVPGAKPAAKPAAQPAVRKTDVQVAREVWAGLWGSGTDRANRLQKAGYNASYIQGLVNKGVGKVGVASDPNRKSTATIAKEVIAGKWGNGPDRVARLKRAGYDAVAVQREVNRQL
jgi:CW_7 repeat